MYSRLPIPKNYVSNCLKYWPSNSKAKEIKEFQDAVISVIKGSVNGGEEAQPQKFLVRATFSSFSRLSHLEILVLRLLCVFKFLNLENKAIFKKSSPVGA